MANAVPSYGKILSLGSAFTEDALVGDIVVQEKVDGSLFGFGVNEHGQILMRSKGSVLTEDNFAQMFDKAVAFVMSKQTLLQTKVPGNTYFYGEYLQKPKHNTLKYGAVPQNNIVLFDAVTNGHYCTREELESWAKLLDVDVIPELWKGSLGDYLRNKNEKGYSAPGDFFKAMTETTTSFLGEEIIEGVVIKNYTQTIMLGGQLFPLFTKYVREAFKERHSADWKIRQPKDTLQGWIEGFKNEARWQKAVIHGKEKGELQQSPRDIGFLIKAIQQDIKEEETENIKNYLYKCFIDDILRKSTHGFPEWYKDQLMVEVKV